MDERMGFVIRLKDLVRGRVLAREINDWRTSLVSIDGIVSLRCRA
jgi:hypothetical protein